MISRCGLNNEAAIMSKYQVMLDLIPCGRHVLKVVAAAAAAAGLQVT